MSQTLLKSIVLPQAGSSKATATVIFAHGLGDQGAGWLDVAQMLRKRPKLQHVRFVLPNSPVQPVTLNGGMPMPSWFDIRTLDDISGGEDEVGLRKSADALSALINAEEAGSQEHLDGQGVPSERVVVGGFSQGGAIGLLCGLTHPKPVAGIVGLSTWLPLRAKMVAPYLTSHARNIPIFLGHGTADQVVKYEYGQRSAKFLRAGGENDGGAGSYDGMAHSACMEEIEHVAEYLEKVIPAQAS
ncbi:Phospholipase/carboxylesterase [Ceraceosorus guamensis]|uniref:Acyl-protein thioesterase 1 n=1 Tax=Ceraceosorus guamensis TaxID=1522189 RepID=A0A316W807_9BASI|nr:Phospholipase/carboxylesterase [Ceraceosorus guamensis]PWN45248.1 Phospholipase/carboxylesterase [Ceraceosorus guamensis]